MASQRRRGIVHKVKVLTAVSTERSSKGMRSPAGVKNSILRFPFDAVFFRKAKSPGLGPMHRRGSLYGIVLVNEINAWANANLETSPLGQGDESFEELVESASDHLAPLYTKMWVDVVLYRREYAHRLDELGHEEIFPMCRHRPASSVGGYRPLGL